MCLGLAGLHNVENATAAIIVGMLLQIPEEKIRAALASFAGVKRRFEYIVQNEKMVYIDDYAHHPEELRACINSVRQMYPGKKLTVIFQPHLFSRTKDFAQEFSEVLSLADQLIVMDIYPARELPMEGVDANLILNQVSIANKQAASKENLMEKLAIMDIELLLTVGAGDIDTMVKPIQELVG
jgi:UDP-N-acetylmuramate--alanine ligase